MKATGRHSDQELAVSFWSQVDQSAGPDECWLWNGPVSLDGFPRFAIPGTKGRRSAARMAYELQYGGLGSGVVVWHQHQERFCVNPAGQRELFPELAKPT